MALQCDTVETLRQKIAAYQTEENDLVSMGLYKKLKKSLLEYIFIMGFLDLLKSLNPDGYFLTESKSIILNINNQTCEYFYASNRLHKHRDNKWYDNGDKSLLNLIINGKK